jgi:dephospho-CoA kinase
MFGKYDNEIIDADEISREVVTPGSKGLQIVVSEFGTDVLNQDGTLSRADLATIVFKDPARRAVLEGILHPLIRARTLERIENSTSGIVIYVVPLLIEAKVDYPFDFVVTIEAGIESQIQRLIEKRGMSAAEARARVAAQASEAERVARADYRLDGSIGLPDLEIAVSHLWDQIQMLAKQKANHGEN